MVDAVPPQHSYTLEIRYVHRAPEIRRIEAQRVVIGRDGGDIVLGDAQASAAHAEIEFENGQLVVRDLGSSNGTWLGQRQLPQFALSPGQVFRCGHTEIRLLEITGGQQLIAGRTMIAEGGVPMPPAPPMPTSMPPSMPAPVAAPAAASKPAAPSTGIIVAAVVGVSLFLGVVIGGAWLVLSSDDAEPIAEAEPEPTPEPTPTPESTKTPPTEATPHEVDLGELYRKIGAATVVVRVPGSVGSGAVIDPSGVILTNHHVINGGVRDGLSLKAKVVFGAYSDELRTFEPRHEQLDAWVIKIDKDHDLALLRLISPPPNLTHLALAHENPYPGQRVAAIGHAGVGMLWAIKGGEVSAAGSLSGHLELLLDAHEGDRAYLEQTKKQFEKMGRVIQSTTKILPGDSGGPLVNLVGEIVGLNAFGRIDEGTNQWLSFHIHLAEIAPFVAEIPTRPVAVVPDPWDSAGSWTRVEDANLDGTAEVLLVSGTVGTGSETSPWGTLIDLDGDSFATGDKSPAAVNGRITELVEKKDFDPEFAVLHEPGGTSHLWYDRDGVDGFDLYIVDEHSLGNPTNAWSLDTFGGAEKLTGLELGNGLRPELFSKPELATAFRSIGAVVFPGQIEAGATTNDDLPKPAHQTDGGAVFTDGNGDGLNDTLTELSAFDQRVFLDLDQNSIARTTSIDALKVLLSVASVDAELATINQGASAWVWYDRDDDGKFDLVLRSHDVASGVAHEAFVMTADVPVAAPEHIGRRLLRPALLSKPTLATLLAANERAAWTAGASDDGLASFPAIARSDAATIIVQDNIAWVTDLGEDLTLVDIDGDSPNVSTEAAAALVRAGEWDAEFALLRRGGVEWAFYDRDDDGRLDWVLVSLDAARDVATHVYEITGSTATPRPADAGGSPINWGTFTNATLREGFARIAPVHWPERAREH